MFTTTTNKFLNIDAPEQPSAPTSVAAIMAKSGVVTTPDTTVEIPSFNTERKEETTQAQEPAPVETTNEASNGESVNQESQTPPTEPVQETTPPIEETPQQVPTWQEVLKQQQPEAIIKELGYDVGAVALAKEIQENKQMLAFFEYWKNNGDVQPYLRELSTDYSKMPAEEVMRHQLRAEYPKASEQQLDILYRKKVVEAYKLNPDLFDEAEVEEGRMLLEAEAEKYRDTMIAKQQEYLLPKPPEPKSQAAEPVEDTGKQQLEAFKSLVEDHSLTKSVFANKSIAIGEGEDAFKYPIQNPETVTDLLFDSQKWAGKLYDAQKQPNGETTYTPNVRKQLLVATFANDPDGFIREIAKHYKALGGKAALDPIENPSTPDGGTPAKSQPAYTSVAEAMAKQGRLVNG